MNTREQLHARAWTVVTFLLSLVWVACTALCGCTALEQARSSDPKIAEAAQSKLDALDAKVSVIASEVRASSSALAGVPGIGTIAVAAGTIATAVASTLHVLVGRKATPPVVVSGTPGPTPT